MLFLKLWVFTCGLAFWAFAYSCIQIRCELKKEGFSEDDIQMACRGQNKVKVIKGILILFVPIVNIFVTSAAIWRSDEIINKYRNEIQKRRRNSNDKPWQTP